MLDEIGAEHHQKQSVQCECKKFKLIIFLLSAAGSVRVTRLDANSATCALAMAVNLAGKPVVSARLGSSAGEDPV